MNKQINATFDLTNMKANGLERDIKQLNNNVFAAKHNCTTQTAQYLKDIVSGDHNVVTFTKPNTKRSHTERSFNRPNGHTSPFKYEVGKPAAKTTNSIFGKGRG